MLHHPHDPWLIAGPYVEVILSSVLGAEVHLAVLEIVNRHVREIRSWFLDGGLDQFEAMGQACHGQHDEDIGSSERRNLIQECYQGIESRLGHY